MRLRTILLALLLLTLFMPAAGAVYIPGQETPDDGLYHIMSDEGSPVVLPEVSIPVGVVLPAMPLLSFQYPCISVSPIVAIPQVDESGSIYLDDIIGQVLPPSMQAYLDSIWLDSLNINMPIL